MQTDKKMKQKCIHLVKNAFIAKDIYIHIYIYTYIYIYREREHNMHLTIDRTVNT